MRWKDANYTGNMFTNGEITM